MSLKLIYPNTNCSETFFLLGPKSNENSYNPVWDLVRSLYTIIRNFLTPEQQFLLGPLPDSRNPFHHASLVPEEGQTNLYCRWVVALDKKDGRTFISVYQQITQTLRDCSSTGYLNASVGIFPQALTGIPPTVAIRIMDESYQRTIPPYMAAIQDYTAFSSSVYGEITPIALAEMFQLTGLGATSLFVDIGSGVANAVCQASVQTGCESYGIEIEHAPAAAAVALVSNVKTRCLMWSTRVGKITVEYGDARTSTELREVRIPKADVVLVNNRIFDAKLNLRLGELLQNLKDGALVISSVPFGTSMHASTRVPRTELPWCITHHVYSDDGNSWNGKAEGYYIGRVNKVL
ncbi:histone methylation protein DOT1-domain-containing protein [Mycena alexandri]|uniref:Histone-lysine N-methyltransferase, H3 lysine-79 specific n=1 Tax=Mycena alexandri TaxID=1745969 RepID=A0AAD6SJC9_9AGAR|nr:histone methylation protein DOT1-domain-containing protein [Mycena alexandri]